MMLPKILRLIKKSIQKRRYEKRRRAFLSHVFPVSTLGVQQSTFRLYLCLSPRSCLTFASELLLELAYAFALQVTDYCVSFVLHSQTLEFVVTPFNLRCLQ